LPRKISAYHAVALGGRLSGESFGLALLIIDKGANSALAFGLDADVGAA
jgi:hypothetical protein